MPVDECIRLLHSAGEVEDPNERFVQVLRYYLAGWHIKPRGVYVNLSNLASTLRPLGY